MRSDLTPRQLAVVDLHARGATYKEIGQVFGLSTHTVHRHLARVAQLHGVTIPLLPALYFGATPYTGHDRPEGGQDTYES